ncbi:MAG: PHP domain-containing protein [Candidatus Aenigmatarchaeota archaeon]|nr:PHP domain-containing protein [Candidatus Aenigmarchaeota archaeon]
MKKYDLHVHTIYSKVAFWGYDALNTPEEIVDAAVKKGLNGIAITDHNTIKGALKAKNYAKKKYPNFNVIIGEEIKTASGDLLGIGLHKEIKPYMSLKDSIDEIHSQGGIAIAPHPFAKFILRECLMKKAIFADAIEVLNACSALKFQNNSAKELAIKYSIPMVAGSDSHSILTLGAAGIICNNDPISEIKNGKVKVFGREAKRKILIEVYYKKIWRSVNWFFSKKRKEELLK